MTTPTPPDAPAPPERGAAAAGARPPSPNLVVRAVVAARLVMIVGIVSFLIAAVALLFYGFAETLLQVAELLDPTGEPISSKQLMLSCIKLIDTVLIATVLLMVAVGLYSLFIDSTIPLPDWLRIDGIDDLKRKLVIMVVIVLGVFFLEAVVTWGSDRNLLPLGVAIAAVILALSVFLLVQTDTGRPPRDTSD